MDGPQQQRSRLGNRRKLVQSVEWWSGSHNPGRRREQVETGPSRSESRRRPSLFSIRLGSWCAPRVDRCTSRGHEASRKIHQSSRSKGYAPLARLDREQSKNRWAVDGRTSGFPSIRGNEKFYWSVLFWLLADMGECTANVRLRE